MIPRGAKHPREAFEFMAYLQRQEVMEKLCRSVCKNSPLKRTSETWVYSHLNPYVDVFDRLAASPNAKSLDQAPIYLEANTDIDAVAQQVYLLKKTPREALAAAQERLDARLRRYHEHANKESQ
jgi:multiple sugar transport system substrate-binding protein